MAAREVFSTAFTVRVSDINYGAHLGNDHVLSLFHEARVRWIASLGWTELDMGGVGLIQTEAHIKYRGQAHLGDHLQCSLSVPEAGSRGFTLAYALSRPSDGVLIARGTTTLRFFDYAEQALTRAPEAVLEQLAAGS